MAFAMGWSSTRWQPASGTSSSSPSAVVTESIAIARQWMPPEAYVANASAMVNGATSFAPRAIDGMTAIE